MRLIIDIPEEVVKAIQDGEDYRYDIHTAIAQGKSYDTSGDLISRNALKEDLIKWFPQFTLEGIEPKTLFNQILHDIDNAPTVDISETISKFRNTAYQNGFTTGLNKRPQGEWIIDEDTIFGVYGNYRKCSICNENAEWLDGGSQFLSNYCPNCGADMRGEKNETD